MRDAELRELLHRAGDEVPAPDVAESTWSRGRVVRRRRWGARSLGALAAATVVGALGAQVAGWPDDRLGHRVEVAGGTGGEMSELLEPPTSVAAARLPGDEAEDVREWDGAQRVEERERAEEARVLARGPTDVLAGSSLLHLSQQVWGDVYAGCLESRGYAVSRDGAALSVTFRDGAGDGDYRRDMQACRAELVTDAPVSVPRLEAVSGEARAALTERYFQYYWVQGCLLDAELPTAPTMPAEEFVAGLAWVQLPPWHPYQEAARQDRYAEAREACPIQPLP